MRAAATRAAAALLLALAACAENSAPGNDREARLDPPRPAAERAPAASLAGVEPGLLKPETMTEADLAGLGTAASACRFRYTEVGFPVLVFPPSGGGAAVGKLNGTLIELAPSGARGAYAAGPVRVELRLPGGGAPPPGESRATLVVRLAGAPDELGFAGVAACP